MSRVSQEELYDDKDVVTQILKLKDTVNDYAGGIIENIDVSGNDLVIDWANGESVSLPLPSPTGISSVTGAVSGGNLTITFYMTDGSSHAFTCQLVGFVTLDTEQSIAAKKIFGVSPEVPFIPATPTGAVSDVYVNDATQGTNNIVHKTGNETLNGEKKMMEPCLMLDKAIGFKAGSATDYLEIVRTSEDREMHIELFASSYKADIIVSLFGTNWGLVNGFGQIVKNAVAYTFDSVITDNGDGTTSLWVQSTAAFCAYIRHNKNWRNNFGIENGYTAPNTVSTTDPRTAATRYKNVTINQVVIQ